MARRREVEQPDDDSTDADDRMREASAMTLLLSTNEEFNCEQLRRVRKSAAALYVRALGPVVAVTADGRRERVAGPVPSRAELDALWALVPAGKLEWARRLVGYAVEGARAGGSTATPQTVTRNERSPG